MARNKRTARIKKPREVKGKHCVDNLRESCLCQEMLQFPMHCDPFWKGDHAVPSPSHIGLAAQSSKMHDPCPMWVKSTDFHSVN